MFAGAALAWGCALPLATWLASGPDARPGVYGFAFAVYGLGSWICHQRPDRSFYLWAMQMPVCARCTGIYLGSAIAALSYVTRGGSRANSTRRAAVDRTIRSTDARIVLVVAAVPTLVMLLVEWLGGGTPSNAIRALAGLPIGAAVAWTVLRAEVN